MLNRRWAWPRCQPITVHQMCVRRAVPAVIQRIRWYRCRDVGKESLPGQTGEPDHDNETAPFRSCRCRGWRGGDFAVADTCPRGETFEVSHTDAEWHKLLTPDQFAVLRKSATERPYTSALLHEERRGNFSCVACDLDLFSSTTKFDSRTGWPSFWTPLDKAV